MHTAQATAPNLTRSMTSTGEEDSTALIKVDVILNPVDATASQLVDAAIRAEASGYDAVWTYDHLSGVSLRGSTCLEVWTALGAIAQATQRVELGPLVLNVPLRHPAHIAIGAATLQDLSQGRCLLGLGAGAGPESRFADEQRMVGITPLGAARRRAMVDATVGYLRALWRGDHHFSSPEYAFDAVAGVLLPVPSPPIVVGATGPKMAALAGRVADGINVFDWSSETDSEASWESSADTGSGVRGLVEVARAVAGDRPFSVTVARVLSPAWLDPDSPIRRRWAAMGVDRVMAHWSASMGLDVLDVLERTPAASPPTEHCSVGWNRSA